MDSILSPLEFSLDYRFGALCVVDAKDAEDWKDTTGVMELHPPSGTTLADRLDMPARPTVIEFMPVVLRNLGTDQRIPVELRLSGEEFQGPYRREWVHLFPEVYAEIRGDPRHTPKEPLPITLRQLLGLILDQADLHCHEENGVLIIEPQPKVAMTAAHAASP